MATSRPRYTVSVDDDLFQKIEDFRYSHRYKNRADATVALIARGLSDVLGSSKSSSELCITDPCEISLIKAYRSDVSMQPAVRRLLGLDNAAPSGHTQPALPIEDGTTIHRDPGDPAFREEIVRYAITQMRELEPDAYNRVFHCASLEDAIAQSLSHDQDNIATSDPSAGQKQA